MTARKKPTPRGLKTTGKTLWRSFLAQFTLTNAELALLRQLCSTADEIDGMEKALAESGPVVTGSMGQPVANPLFGALATHRKLFDQLTTALALPIPGEAFGRRRSGQQKIAVAENKAAPKSRGRIIQVQRTQTRGDTDTEPTEGGAA